MKCFLVATILVSLFKIRSMGLRVQYVTLFATVMATNGQTFHVTARDAILNLHRYPGPKGPPG